MKTITYNPETHVLVPIEPSEEMFNAGLTAMRDGAMCGRMYKAFIAAAPQPEPVESEPVYQICMANSVSLSRAWIDVDEQTYHDAGLYEEYKLRALYTTPQPDRTAELEAALKAISTLLHEYKMGNTYKNKFVEGAIAKINEVLK